VFSIVSIVSEIVNSLMVIGVGGGGGVVVMYPLYGSECPMYGNVREVT
jgi:hypothetical protein